jgi:hypothetical protein
VANVDTKYESDNMYPTDFMYQKNATIHGPITCYSNDKPITGIDGCLESIFRPIWKNYGLVGIENPDLPPPPIYRRIFHVPEFCRRRR